MIIRMVAGIALTCSLLVSVDPVFATATGKITKLTPCAVSVKASSSSGTKVEATFKVSVTASQKFGWDITAYIESRRESDGSLDCSQLEVAGTVKPGETLTSSIDCNYNSLNRTGKHILKVEVRRKEIKPGATEQVLALQSCEYDVVAGGGAPEADSTKDGQRPARPQYLSPEERRTRVYPTPKFPLIEPQYLSPEERRTRIYPTPKFPLLESQNLSPEERGTRIYPTPPFPLVEPQYLSPEERGTRIYPTPPFPPLVPEAPMKQDKKKKQAKQK